MEDQYDITFPVCGDSNFVEDIAAATFNDTSNQRLRRGIEREVGSVWYDRLPKEVSQKGTLKKYDVVYEKKGVDGWNIPSSWVSRNEGSL